MALTHRLQLVIEVEWLLQRHCWLDWSLAAFTQGLHLWVFRPCLSGPDVRETLIDARLDRVYELVGGLFPLLPSFHLLC